MSRTNQQGRLLLIFLVFALSNLDAYGLSVPKTHCTLVGDLSSKRAAGAATELAAGGLTREDVARLSDARYRKYIVEEDMSIRIKEKEKKRAKELLEEHHYQMYNLPLKYHAHAKTLIDEAAQKEIDFNMYPSDLTGNWVDVGSERVKCELIEDTPKKDGVVDKAYKALNQIQAVYTQERLEREDFVKNLQRSEQDPTPLTREVSELDDEEYIMEAAKHDLGPAYGLKLWRRSRERLHLAVEHAYNSALPIISEVLAFRGSSIARMTASDARMSLLGSMIDHDGEIPVPVFRNALEAVRRCQEDEKMYKNVALVMADRYWMESGKISSGGKRYKGLTPFSPYDSIMAKLEKLKSSVENWFKMLHGWWNQDRTPNGMKSLAIVPDKGAELD